jgi:hypothetical protein
MTYGFGVAQAAPQRLATGRDHIAAMLTIPEVVQLHSRNVTHSRDMFAIRRA